MAGIFAPVAVGVGLAGAAFVGARHALRKSRVGAVLATFTASVLALAVLGLVLAIVAPG